MSMKDHQKQSLPRLSKLCHCQVIEWTKMSFLLIGRMKRSTIMALPYPRQLRLLICHHLLHHMKSLLLFHHHKRERERAKAKQTRLLPQLHFSQRSHSKSSSTFASSIITKETKRDGHRASHITIKSGIINVGSNERFHYHHHPSSATKEGGKGGAGRGNKRRGGAKEGGHVIEAAVLTTLSDVIMQRR